MRWVLEGKWQPFPFPFPFFPPSLLLSTYLRLTDTGIGGSEGKEKEEETHLFSFFPLPSSSSLEIYIKREGEEVVNRNGKMGSSPLLFRILR